MTTPQPVSVAVALADGNGSPAALAAAVRAMGGNDRGRLLDWLCAAYPDVVRLGLAQLDEQHEAAAERRRVRRNRSAKVRRRRQRASA